MLDAGRISFFRVFLSSDTEIPAPVWNHHSKKKNNRDNVSFHRPTFSSSCPCSNFSFSVLFNPTSKYILTRKFDAAIKIATSSLFLRAPIRNSTLSHQEASKMLLVHGIKIRLPWRHFRLKRLVPNKVCIYATMGNKWLIGYFFYNIYFQGSFT